MARITEGLLNGLLRRREANELTMSQVVAELNKRARAKVIWHNYTCINCKEVQKFGKDEDLVAGYCLSVALKRMAHSM